MTNGARLVELIEAFRGARILVVGDVMLDRFVSGSIHRVSPEAPIPVLSIEQTCDGPGGAANVARNLASLGAEATLIGVTGSDAAASDLRTQLAALPRVRQRLYVDGTRPTTVKLRYMSEQQQVLRADLESTAPVDGRLAEALIAAVRAELRRADVVILSDYAKGVLSDQVVSTTVRLALEAGKEVVIDPKEGDFSRYVGASLLAPNRLELERGCSASMCELRDIVRCARALISAGVCRDVVVKCGADGMTLVEEGGGVARLPALADRVVDACGAGDTVVAALALGRAAGGTTLEAAQLAAHAAAIVVGAKATSAAGPAELLASLRMPGADGKILTAARAATAARAWRDSGMRVCFTNGCFDLLHPGHRTLIERARSMADRLVVGLNGDASVSRLKGPGRPVQNELTRARALASLDAVDAVVVFGDDTPIQLIRELRPEVLVKGSDYTIESVVGADLVRSWGGRVELVELLSGHSTSAAAGGIRSAAEE